MEENNNMQASSSSSAPSLTGSEVEEFLKTLPPGYRFCPTDDELVMHYLTNKINNQPLPLNFIPEVKLYDNDPPQLTAIEKPLAETEWYFFSSRDRKYPKGSRPSRSTPNGYWKPTGVDKPIPAGSSTPLGKKTTLDFYQGRQGDKNHGIRTDWKMHEYVLKDSTINSNGMTLNNFVLCKLYKKKYKKEKNCSDDNEGNKIAAIEQQQQQQATFTCVNGDDDQENNNAAIEQQPLMSSINYSYISSSYLTEMAPLPLAQQGTVCNDISVPINEMPLPMAQQGTVCNNNSVSVNEAASSSSLMLVEDQKNNNIDQFEDKAAPIQPINNDDYLTCVNGSYDFWWGLEFLENDGSAAPKDPSSAKGI